MRAKENFMKNVALFFGISVSFAIANANELRCRDMALFRTISHLNNHNTDPDTKALYDYSFGTIESVLLNGNRSEVYEIYLENEIAGPIDSGKTFRVTIDPMPPHCNLQKIENI